MRSVLKLGEDGNRDTKTRHVMCLENDAYVQTEVVFNILDYNRHPREGTQPKCGQGKKNKKKHEKISPKKTT